jgi:hypothetical protein
LTLLKLPVRAEWTSDEHRADRGEQERHGVQAERQPPHDAVQQRRQRRADQLGGHRLTLLLGRAVSVLLTRHDPAQRGQFRARLDSVDQAGQKRCGGQQVNADRSGQQGNGYQAHHHRLQHRRHD